MKKATRQQEIYIIAKCMQHTDNKIKLRTMVMHTLLVKKLTSKRISNFAKNKFPEVWEWKEFLVTLQLGWRRYFYICGHKDSIFVRIQVHQLKSTGGCVCCLYWRGIATGFLLAIILASLFNLGKFLL